MRTTMRPPHEPVRMPPEEAPWGHDRTPTVREYTRAYPVSAAFVGVVGLIATWLLHQNTRNDLWPILFIPIVPLFYWTSIWLFIHGWIEFKD
jgi:hypothetical protein